MGEQIELWGHGVNLEVEFPENATLIQRMGHGTVVRQAAGTDNWCHISVPTAIPSDGLGIDSVRLKAELNGAVRISQLHLWQGDGIVIRANDLNLAGPVVDHTVPIGGVPTDGPLSASMLIEFPPDGSGGEVNFIALRVTVSRTAD